MGQTLRNISRRDAESAGQKSGGLFRKKIMNILSGKNIQFYGSRIVKNYFLPLRVLCASAREMILNLQALF
jgi:hypothetical protein